MKEAAMKRVVLTALFAALAANAATPPVKRSVNIGDPDAMKQFSKSNPATFAKAQGLLCEIDTRPARGAKEWARTKYGAESLEHVDLMQTSEPAKKRISFILDDMRFAGTYKLGQWKCS
jgi:hypothetical protein